MQIRSAKLELLILKTLASSNKKQLSKLVRVLNPKCFQFNASKEVYNRVMTMASQRGIIMGWDELCFDPAINESTRKKLLAFKKKPIKNPERLERSIETLIKYRKYRAGFDSASYILEELKKEKSDPDILLLEAQSRLGEAQFNSKTENWFTDIGGSDRKARRAIRNLLKDSTSQFIPTGLSEFDSRNIGIPRGTFFVIQTNSGGGKSVLANQMCGNMAIQGARVCLVPLEMTTSENQRRHVARITDTEMGKVINTKKLSDAEKAKITASWMRYHKKIKKAGGLLSIFAPEEDMTIEEILFNVKPRNFDVVIIDYIGLLKGTDGDDQARKLGAAGRFCKRFADINNMCIGVCAQLSDDNKVRYSRAINEHSGLSFSWQYDQKAKDSKIVKVDLPKSRNQDNRPFYLREEFKYMRFGEVDAQEAKKHQEDQTAGRIKGGRNKDEFNSRKTHAQPKITRNKAEERKIKANKALVTEEDFVS